jgi:ankyrin repeat protein
VSVSQQDEFYQSLRNGDEGRCVEILTKHPSVAMSRTKLLFGGQSGAPEDFAGRTHCALTAAANMGARHVTAALLDAGAPIDSTGMFSETALHVAAWLGYADLVALLIARGAPLEVRDGTNDGTPFHWAVHGSSPEAWADKRQQVRAARLLITSGARFTQGDLARMEREFAPLPAEMLALFRELRAGRARSSRRKPGAEQRQAREQLIGAIERGDLGAVDAMTAGRPKLVDAANAHGNTPLSVAIQSQRVEIARLLIERGADCRRRNHGGSGVMDIAAAPGGDALVALLRTHGVEYSPEHAAGCGDLAYLRERLDREPGLVDAASGRRRECLLHVAARRGQLPVVNLLLERGARVDSLDKEGFTPLAVLAAYGPQESRPAIAGELLARGAAVTARCGYGGRDVLGFARWKRDRALVAVLENAGRPTAGEASGGRPRRAPEGREGSRAPPKTFFQFCVTLPERGDLESMLAMLDEKPALAADLLHGVRDGPDRGRYSVMAYATWLCRVDPPDGPRSVVRWLLTRDDFAPDLWTALALDDRRQLRRLLSEGPASARARHPLFGHPALEIARPSQHATLVAHGADDGTIFTAVVLGDIAAASALLEADPSLALSSRTDVDRASLLAHAITWKQDAFACRLLDLGADPDRPDDNGYTPRRLAPALGCAAVAARLARTRRRSPR